MNLNTSLSFFNFQFPVFLSLLSACHPIIAPLSAASDFGVRDQIRVLSLLMLMMIPQRKQCVCVCVSVCVCVCVCVCVYVYVCLYPTDRERGGDRLGDQAPVSHRLLSADEGGVEEAQLCHPHQLPGAGVWIQ